MVHPAVIGGIIAMTIIGGAMMYIIIDEYRRSPYHVHIHSEKADLHEDNESEYYDSEDESPAARVLSKFGFRKRKAYKYKRFDQSSTTLHTVSPASSPSVYSPRSTSSHRRISQGGNSVMGLRADVDKDSVGHSTPAHSSSPSLISPTSPRSPTSSAASYTLVSSPSGGSSCSEEDWRVL
ncbi:hypothetical protein BZG36_03632 [Bifiguratus adelaidae]|uniref:Uncharacterized protein n=1 Tax=Bifiguratus adelaidae TaxID=1938954 RepID=A0A261Y080_9FUNG|nr:hypothetical protein BZG36_03632 [Bifiguratus adelaidae]